MCNALNRKNKKWNVKKPSKPLALQVQAEAEDGSVNKFQHPHQKEMVISLQLVPEQEAPKK